MQLRIDSSEKSVRLCELESFVQSIREKSDSTLLVPGMMLAMTPKNLCRSSNSLPSGLQQCLNDTHHFNNDSILVFSSVMIAHWNGKKVEIL